MQVYNCKLELSLSLVFILLVAAVISDFLVLSGVIGRSKARVACSSDEACGRDMRCFGSVGCVQKCSKHSNCNANQVCYKGLCRKAPQVEKCKCRDGACGHCPHGGDCSDSGVCVPAAAKDCLDTSVCESKVGINYCDLNEQCVKMPSDDLPMAPVKRNRYMVDPFQKVALVFIVLLNLPVLMKAFKQLQSGNISSRLLLFGLVNILMNLACLLLVVYDAYAGVLLMPVIFTFQATFGAMHFN